jgi:MFS family permease
VQGNFSNLTSGVLEVTEPRQRGATVAVYSCIGFAGGFIGTLLFGVALDWFGGTARLAAWVVAFGICAIACLTTVLLALAYPAVPGRGRRPSMHQIDTEDAERGLTDSATSLT